MATEQKNQTNKQVSTQQNTEKSSEAIKDMELAFADALLDQVDIAQQQIRSIQTDIALLQTMENALCLISENMAKIRRLARDMIENDVTEKIKSVASDAIRNLTMVNMLILEDTEFNGHLLFKDAFIAMSSSQLEKFVFKTEKIPDVCGVESGDFQAILDSMEGVSRIINKQYVQINTMMLSLLESYRQVRSEINLIRKAYSLNETEQNG